MAWRVTTWLRVVRLLQLVGALVCAALNGFIIVVIYTRRRAPDGTALVNMEWMICIVLLMTAIILLVVHTGKRVQKQAFLAATVVIDLILLGILMAIFSIQSNGGLPDNCNNIALKNPTPSDKPYGFFLMPEVDLHCNLMRTFFGVTCALFYSYIATVVLSCISMNSNTHLRNKRALALDDLSREELGTPKPIDASSPGGASVPLSAVRSYGDNVRPSRRPAPAPASEGVTSPRASLLSHAPQQQQDSGILPVMPARKPVAISLDIPSGSSRTVSEVHPSSSSSAHLASTLPSSAPSLSTPVPHSPIQLVPGMISDNSAEMEAAAALTTDGPRLFGREGGGAGFYEPGAGGGHGNGEGSSNRIPGLPPPYSPATPQYLQHIRREVGDTDGKGG